MPTYQGRVNLAITTSGLSFSVQLRCFRHVLWPSAPKVPTRKNQNTHHPSLSISSSYLRSQTPILLCRPHAYLCSSTVTVTNSTTMSVCSCSRCFQCLDRDQSQLSNSSLVSHANKISIRDMDLPTYQQATGHVANPHSTIMSRPRSSRGIFFIEGNYVMKSNGYTVAAIYELTQPIHEVSHPFTGDLKNSTRIIGLTRIDLGNTFEEPTIQTHVFDLQQIRFHIAGYSKQSSYILAKDTQSQNKYLEAKIKQALLGRAWVVESLTSGKMPKIKPAKNFSALKAYPKIYSGKAGYEWKDDDEELTAYEVQVGAGQQAKPLLNIINASSQEAADFMVAVWCMRVWSAAIDSNQGSTTTLGKSKSLRSLMFPVVLTDWPVKRIVTGKRTNPVVNTNATESLHDIPVVVSDSHL